MTEERFNAGNFSARVLRCNTAIVGTGAAGYNAADRLWQYGQKDILLITEKRTAGTSRNTGSDKQTYYKLTLSGGDPDSVREMAETLFDGQCVDGDIVLCEAALSTQGFLKLAELGVPFPRNRYGEYIGYKTDHDPRRRATSVGPYTSKQMTEKLEAAVTAKGVPMLDNTQVIKIVSDGERVLGLLCLNTKAQSAEDRYLLVRCKNVVYATGGPAGIYADSVYPASQFGATGLALEAGVKGKNLTEWQYGLASTRPRWNVSGTYMQVLPRVYSAEPDGSDPREFLMDFFTTPGEMLSKLFLKGYQWPFDVRKVASGSSIIDILVYLESCKGRKVYLDYRTNPVDGNFRFEELDAEALDYLTRAGACFGTPIERLLHMNAPAVDFYRDKGVDLAAEPLEISLCAQHNNGGLDIDCWWQTNLKGFFAVGEVAASHGVYRHESLHEKMVEGLYQEKTKSPYTVTIGSDYAQYGNLLASSLVIAMYNGSLAHILLIYEKVRKFVFYLSCKYTDWNPRRSLLQLAVFAGNGSEISNLQNSYPEILNHMMADDAAMVMDFCNNNPIPYKRFISQLLGFGTVGYYLSDTDFQKYEALIVEGIKDFLNDDNPVIFVGQNIFKGLNGVAYRMPQSTLVEICILFMDTRTCSILLQNESICRRWTQKQPKH